jgi:CheY-like chemotaxis protein
MTSSGPLPLALLADYDPDTRRMYADFLRFSSYDVDETDDGRDALAKALSRCPDIVVSDTRLPGITGVELCRLLRSDIATQTLPIVLVTADASPASVRQAEIAGADAVLVKPCLPETLLSEVARLLAHSAQLRERARELRHRLHSQLERSERLITRSLEHSRQLTLMRLHSRKQTKLPSWAPPPLTCPTCDRALQYDYSYVGGVSVKQPEQWDYFKCTSCGTFQYRHRTRKLKRVV